MIKENKSTMLLVFVGTSGTGKTTLCDYLQKTYRIPRVVTHTTRPKRANEIEGRDYYFESNKSWSTNDYIEQATYSGYLYGSSQQGILRARSKSANGLVSLIVDSQGAKAYANKFPAQQLQFVFVKAPLSLLKKRLVDRGDDPKMIEKRLNSLNFKKDSQLPEFLKDRVTILVNSKLSVAEQQLDEIISTLFINQEKSDSNELSH